MFLDSVLGAVALLTAATLAVFTTISIMMFAGSPVHGEEVERIEEGDSDD